ncbi:MAG: HmuY family protein [Flavobacteriales bacterium]|nr:HmuY family protein [Flavobacteriales bacterium]MEB2342181.1 HmuY family protein [Flavobacteriia bacterium]
MKGMRLVGMIMLSAALGGCMREELPVPKQPRGDAVECAVHVGPDYNLQLWFSFDGYHVVAQNSKMDWDLAFESAPDGWQVRLNYSRLMRTHRSTAAWGEPADTAGFGNTWKIDLPDGRTDSVALGDWRDGHPIYILDMGYNASGMLMGLRKLQVLGNSATSFEFRTARLDGTDSRQYTVLKDPARPYTHFSLASESVVTISPPLGEYDLVFTQYTEQFRPPDPYQAYLVTGVVNGYSGARVAQLTGDFASVTLDDTLAHPFSTDQDIIGYDWKDYSFETGYYEVYSDQVYIIQCRSGYFYKLHFIDYYDDQGLKGSPKFEVVPL